MLYNGDLRAVLDGNNSAEMELARLGMRKKLPFTTMKSAVRVTSLCSVRM